MQLSQLTHRSEISLVLRYPPSFEAQAGRKEWASLLGSNSGGLLETQGCRTNTPLLPRRRGVSRARGITRLQQRGVKRKHLGEGAHFLSILPLKRLSLSTSSTEAAQERKQKARENFPSHRYTPRSGKTGTGHPSRPRRLKTKRWFLEPAAGRGSVESP